MARKSKGLPFVVQPRMQPVIERIGSDVSGIIEIRRQGYLSVAEKTIVDQASADMSDQGEMLAAVKSIALAEGRSVTDIFEELQDPEGSELINKYTAEIAAASASAKNQDGKIQILAATALLMCRVDANWTVKDTMELHPDLLDGLSDLYRDEDARSIENLTQDPSATESTVKK